MESQVQNQSLDQPLTASMGSDFSRAHRLLIVDDDSTVRKALVEVLRHSGYECDQAASADEAMVYLQQQSYTCVLTDLMMPERSGIELLRDIVSTYPDIAVIMISGQNDSVQVRRALKTGAFD
jgi:DNA-binding NtrC family response regulator